MPDIIDELRLLIRSRHPIVTIETDEEQRALGHVTQAADSLAIRVFKWNLVHGLRASPGHAATSYARGSLGDPARLAGRGESRASPPAPVQPIPDTQKPADVLAYMLGQTHAAVFVLKDLCTHLKDATLQRMVRTFGEYGPNRNQTAILIDPATDLPQALARVAVPLQVSLPDEAELDRIVRETFKELSRYSKIRHELTKDEFHHILRTLRGLTAREAKLAIARVILDDDCLDASDIDKLLKVKREMVREAGLLEYVDAPVSVDELGGLRGLKDWLSKRHGALTPEAKAFGLRPPRGILLLGVQGCGKSLACKAVASMWRMPLLKLDPGQLYDRFVGESERNLRKAIKLAEAIAPAVLWIDEIEKAFASAAAHSADGGLSQRMFGSLLGWLQDHREPIFVVATANDIQALPPELMRKGRFDEIFFVDLPDAEARATIFAVHLRARGRDPARFDLPALATAADGFSGAEIEQAVVGALYSAFRDKSEIDTRGILAELANTRPLSVTMAERIAELRAWAADRCVPA